VIPCRLLLGPGHRHPTVGGDKALLHSAVIDAWCPLPAPASRRCQLHHPAHGPFFRRDGDHEPKHGCRSAYPIAPSRKPSVPESSSSLPTRSNMLRAGAQPEPAHASPRPIVSRWSAARSASRLPRVRWTRAGRAGLNSYHRLVRCIGFGEPGESGVEAAGQHQGRSGPRQTRGRPCFGRSRCVAICWPSTSPER